MKYAYLLPGLATCLIAAGHAATPPAGFEACSQMQDPSQRLGCYDARMAEFKSAARPAAGAAPSPQIAGSVGVPQAHAASPAPAAVTAAPAAAEVPKFGADELPLKARPKVEAEQVLQSSISAVRLAQNLYVISLANGQVWRQAQSGTQIVMFFRPGNEVRIEKGMLGDYRMSTTQTGAKNWIRVTRIQ